jgi:hypothetical protein
MNPDLSRMFNARSTCFASPVTTTPAIRCKGTRELQPDPRARACCMPEATRRIRGGCNIPASS